MRFTGKRDIADASEQGGRDKYRPGTYYASITKGVYRVSDQIANAIYFGVETLVVLTVAADNHQDYGPSQRKGQAASWVFNLNHPNQNFQYLADGNVRNLAQAIIDTHGFEDKMKQAGAWEIFLTLWTKAELDQALDEAFCREHKFFKLDAEGNQVLITKADPWAYVCDILVDEGGEAFIGLPLKVTARDARSKNKVDANKFCACHCTGVTAEELVEFYGVDPATLVEADTAAAS